LAAVGEEDSDLHVMMNMSDARVNMEIPTIKNRCWNLSVDTSKSYPNDAVLPGDQVHYNKKYYPVEPKSVVVLESSFRKWWIF
jgi:isoamylase